MPKIQIYFIACVVYKITCKLDARGRDIPVHTMKVYIVRSDINPLIHNFEVSHPRCVDQLSNQKNILNIWSEQN